MPGSTIRLIGNTIVALAVLTFVLPWVVAQGWPDAAGLGGAAPSQVLVSAQAGGIPPRVLTAIMAASETECHMPWYVLAGVSKVESDHAHGGQLDANGNTTSTIFGPEIAWLDTQARGPFQFIPSSWALFGRGGNVDNIDDSAMAAARHLCSSAGNKTDRASIRKGVLGYNQSEAYADDVLGWADRYSTLAPQGADSSTKSVLGDVAAFWAKQQQTMNKDGMPMLGWAAGKASSFWGWVGHGSTRPAQFAQPAAKGAPDPQCPGRSLTQDGRFQAPPGTTTPDMTAQVARALRARFGTSSSMLRAVADRSASDGAAICSDHLWGGGLDTDTSAQVMAWTAPWQDKLFRFRTDDYADGHAHLSMNESVDPRQLAAFLDATCAGVDCAGQAGWDPPAQFSHYGEGSLLTLST